MMGFDGTWNTKGVIILRTIKDREMIIGAIAPVLPEGSDTKNMGSGQLWVGNIILIPSKRFYLPESYGGWQADDLLRADMDTSTMEEVK
jgi:hypothetical protein